MSELEPRTGIAQVDSDLHELRSLVQDRERLAAAKQAAEDESLDINQLGSAIPPNVINIIVALSHEEELAAIASRIEEHTAKDALQHAVDLVREHFPRLYHHPAVVGQMRRTIDDLSRDRDDPERRINAVGWDASWGPVDGKLAPGGLLRLRDRANKVLLTSPLDWDDMAFLISALCRHLATHMEKSEPIVEADLLVIPDADKISRRIEEASHALQRIRELGAGIGLATPESGREGK